MEKAIEAVKEFNKDNPEKVKSLVERMEEQQREMEKALEESKEMETLKIVVTITDVSAVVYAGGSPTSKSVIIEISGEDVPIILGDYLHNMKRQDNEENFYCYQQVSFSLLKED